MPIFLLDTTVIIDVVNGKKGRTQFLDTLLAERSLLACCSINVTEVFAGIRPHEMDFTVGFLRSLRFYDVTWEIARLAGDLQRQWRRKGRTLALPDVTIAAVAMTNGLVLLTGNHKDFPMPDLSFFPLPN